MFKKIKRNMFFMSAVFLVAIFCFGFFISTTVSANSSEKLNITVVLDAGHGGADGGTVGTKTGITESELNLKYTQKLTNFLQDFGITVVNTRTNMNGLYESMTDDFKLVDMKNRVKAINESNAQILVSIHMNKYTSSGENGAQVFFKDGNDDSEKLAGSIRDMLLANFDNARKLVLKGDYYILNNTNIIGVIVECGFLSNPEEEVKLQEDDYQNKMCYSIFAGILKYLDVIKY